MPSRREEHLERYNTFSLYMTHMATPNQHSPGGHEFIILVDSFLVIILSDAFPGVEIKIFEYTMHFH